MMAASQDKVQDKKLVHGFAIHEMDCCRSFLLTKPDASLRGGVKPPECGGATGCLATSR